MKKSLGAEIQDIKKELSSNQSKISNLDDKIEQLEMYSRRNGVRIHGIPENKDENTDELVLKIAEDIGADIPKLALGRSHRVGKRFTDRKAPRPIIVKYISHNYKTELLKHKNIFYLKNSQRTVFT